MQYDEDLAAAVISNTKRFVKLFADALDTLLPPPSHEV
jgi:hypothetical protein